MANLLRSLPLLAILALPLVVPIVGCGGAGAESAVPKGSTSIVRGRLAVHVSWPKSTTRVVPTATKSMRIELWANGEKTNEQLLVAPDTTALFEDYPLGQVEARVTAYSEVDGTGNPVAKGTGTGTFEADTQGSIPVTLASTTVRIEGYPSAHYGFPGDTPMFEVYAEDVDGQVVAQDLADVSAVSADPTIADVDPMGTVKMLAEGETTITLTDRNSGQTCELHVVVMNP